MNINIMKPNINIIPINEQNNNILSFLKDSLRKKFLTQVKVLDKINIGNNFYNSSRNQYNANKILNFVISDLGLSDSRDIFLSVFNKDLYTSSLNFVFGLAGQYPRACIISVCRLNPEFYECKETKDDKNHLYFSRIKKEAIHEIGHTIGLEHCNNPNCVMYFSNTLEDTDNKEDKFCDNCKKFIG